MLYSTPSSHIKLELPDAISTLANRSQPANTLVPSTLNEVGRLIYSNLSQSAKAPFSIVEHPSGITIRRSCVHPLKAPFSIVSNPLGNETLLNDMFSEKASAPIVFTPLGTDTAFAVPVYFTNFVPSIIKPLLATEDAFVPKTGI